MSCVYFSKISPIKGAFVALDAAAAMPDVEFHFYGSVADDFIGEFSRRVEAQANVTYHGVFDSATGDSAAELARYNVHLFPTLCPNEGVPGCVVESKFAGIPTVATDRCWNRDLVEDGVDGLIMRGENACALACALRAYETNRDLLAAHADAARASSGYYCIDRYVDDIVDELVEAGAGL